MTNIDIEKFISSLIERSSGITQQIFHSDLLNALKEQGLEYKNGEIVKTQRRTVAEAKEAIFDNEDEKIKKAIIRILKGEVGYTSKEDTDKYVAWLEKQYKKDPCKDCDHPMLNCQNFPCDKKQGKLPEDCVRKQVAEAKEALYDKPRWSEEDEGIRKRIYNYINVTLDDNESEEKEKWLAWLEKQGNNNNQNWKPSKEQINALKHFVRSIAESGYASPYNDNTKLLFSLLHDLEKLEAQGNEPNWCHHKVDLSDCSEEYQKGYYDGWNNCNMQHSQCKSELDDVVKCLINGMKFNYEGNEEATWGTDKWSMPVKHIIEVLERQRKQTRTDNAKPKFKVGDWITNGEAVFHIIDYNAEHGYQLATRNGASFHFSDAKVENKYHLWSILDAKDGDVLTCSIDKAEIGGDIERLPNITPTICLYWKVVTDPEYIHTYCSLYNEDFLKFKNAYYNTFVYNICPATEEQKKLLFQQIKEAGCEWNPEAKELKKLTQSVTKTSEQVWSEDDEKNFKFVNTYLELIMDDKPFGNTSVWLKSLKDRLKGE